LCAARHAQAHAGPLRTVLHQTSIGYIGRISYSLYLWHWPVFVLFRWTVGLEGLWPALAALALSGGLAALSYHVIERPSQRWFHGAQWPSGRLLWRGWLAVGITAVLCAGLVQARGQLSLTTPMQNANEWYPNKEHARIQVPSTPRAPESGPRVFVVGDSHAGAYLPMFTRAKAELGADIRVFWSAGCATISAHSAPCKAFIDKAFKEILTAAQPGDVVFLPGLRTRRLADQSEVHSFNDIFKLELAEANARNVHVMEAVAALRPILGNGVRVVLELPKPLIPAPTFRCVDWFNKGNPLCRHGLQIEREAVMRLTEPARQALLAVQRQLPDIELWDPFPMLCPGSTCGALLPDGSPIFFDADHLSNVGNELVAEDWMRMISTKPPSPALGRSRSAT
jgi:SGNH domain (fused to AT3 domains)